MDTSVLKKFAQESRRYLMDVVTKKMEYFLTSDNVEIRAKKHLIEDLKNEISNSGKDLVIEKIAYTWFNRFCALRYMDVKQYSLVGVLTPVSESHTQPEILMEAKSGHIKDELGNLSSRDHVIGLLSGKISSNDPQSEAYKHLVLMSCNYYYSIMPFLFEKIDDYTELLMPDDLLSEASIISKVRDALSEKNCKDVEVIGWLYQFYISEKKDEVFEGLKKNKKITPENIPAATQLFTPNWIVRYLVENSLGRLWMLNCPNSNLISKMEYYIKPESEEKDFLKIKGPEEIKVCDPACGSGHMLVYAFDLLYSMYEEVGIDSKEIPSLILKNNLFGIEIDKRAGELAAFALTMKAREKQRRYFGNPISPNICVLENIHFEESEITDYMDHVGHDLFSSQLSNTLKQFEEAKNFGSLIRPEVSDVENILNLLDQKNVSGHLFLTQTHSKVLKVLSQVKSLSPIYHVVIANPPYMGSKGMNQNLINWGKANFEDCWDGRGSDLFAMFIDRSQRLCKEGGYRAMITMQSWMFLSSFESLRRKILKVSSLMSMLHLGANAFDTISGEVVQTVAFVLKNQPNIRNQGIYLKIIDGSSETEKKNIFFSILKGYSNNLKFSVSSEELDKVSGCPIAYWISNELRDVFLAGKPISEQLHCIQGIITGNTNKFLRFWYEISKTKIAFDIEEINSIDFSQRPWVPYTKGGEARKWYGNLDYVINWENRGTDLVRPRSENSDKYFKECITWNLIGSGSLPVRYCPPGFLWDVAGSVGFPVDINHIYELLGLMCSDVIGVAINALNPTINTNIENIQAIPVITLSKELNDILVENVKQCIEIAKADWDEHERSLNFEKSPLYITVKNEEKISDTYSSWRLVCQKRLEKIINLENENNRILANAYGVEYCGDKDHYSICLNSNPYYGSDTYKLQDDVEKLFKVETLKEFISYAVGCIFGRYSLTKNGVIIASQNDSLDLFSHEFDRANFYPDDDNVIPILDGDWFLDDITNKFKLFLSVCFGKKYFEENLKFVEDVIGKDISKYFAKDFYNDHVKMFKKRPIYWMFSSPKGTFNALIYMHRYTPDTVSIVLNSYLREFRAKLNSKRENLERLSVAEATSARDKTAALKEIEQLKKMIIELDEYEKDILYPLATQRLEIDLDDGVKSNYSKFGKALKPIKGLDKDED